MSHSDHEKFVAARASLTLIEDGMVVGLGTGSTAAIMLDLLGARVRDGLEITGVPTSHRTRERATALGIPLAALNDVHEIHLTIDGADEIDPALDLIKGGGGAMLHEKLVASASRRLIIVADSSKQVQQLGAFPLPVEVVPLAWSHVARRIRALGCEPALRLAPDERPFTTDEGNYLLDCPFGRIDDATLLAERLDAMVGVVEHGLFLRMASLVIVGRGGSARQIARTA